jgi:hypothetical protein
MGIWGHRYTGGVLTSLFVGTIFFVLLLFKLHDTQKILKNTCEQKALKIKLDKEQKDSIQKFTKNSTYYNYPLFQKNMVLSLKEQGISQVLEERMQEWKEKFKLISIVSKIHQEQMLSKKLNIVKYIIHLKLQASHDRFIRNFFKDFHKNLPGVITLDSFHMKKEKIKKDIAILADAEWSWYVVK